MTTRAARKDMPSVRAVAQHRGIHDAACEVCGSPRVERAHIVALMLNGDNDLDNLVLLCRAHHRAAPDTRDADYFHRWRQGAREDFYRQQAAREERQVQTFNDLIAKYEVTEDELRTLASQVDQIVKPRLSELMCNAGIHSGGLDGTWDWASEVALEEAIQLVKSGQVQLDLLT